jgi:hypothetical protein
MVFFKPGGEIAKTLPVKKRLSEAEYLKIYKWAKLHKRL